MFRFMIYIGALLIWPAIYVLARHLLTQQLKKYRGPQDPEYVEDEKKTDWVFQRDELPREWFWAVMAFVAIYTFLIVKNMGPTYWSFAI